MKLVMTDCLYPKEVTSELAAKLDGFPQTFDYNGKSTTEILEQLDKEAKDVIVVTADSRFLLFNQRRFDIDDVYIYADGKLKPIRECTRRILRVGHHLFKLYETNEFSTNLTKRN